MSQKILSVLLLCSICSCQQRDSIALNSAQFYLDSNPQKTITILDSIQKLIGNRNTDVVMQCELLRLQAYNKLDINIDTVKSINKVIEYYNTNGNEHDKMIAKYMMGCFYRDRGDAPSALRCYQDAIQFGDTLNNNCDYKTISRIYGQMASLYHEQRSPRLELNAERMAVKYALIAKDTISSFIFYEHLADPYFMMNMMDSAMYYCKAASDSFLKYGQMELSVGMMPMMISYYLKRNSTDTAKIMIDLFETKSGAFDRNMNIDRGREIYYAIKGNYYNLIDQLDSAQFFYRKLLKYENDINNVEAAYHGLMSIYLKLRVEDSIVKYANLYAAANDSSILKHTSDEITRLQSIYNYNEYFRLAFQKEKESKRKQLIIYGGILVFIILALFVIWLFYRIKKKRKAELVAMNTNYYNVIDQYNRAQAELTLAREGHEYYKMEKQKEIKKLNDILAVYQDDHLRPEMWNIESALLSSPIVDAFRKLASRAKKPTDSQWQDLEFLLGKHLPEFCEKIRCDEYNLTEKEIRICILIKLCFIPSEQVVLLDLSKQRITNIRANINSKMFKEKGTRSLDTKIRRI